MKITKYILSMAAALGMLAGCYKPEMVQIAAPEDVVAPVLDAVEGPIEITSANMANGVVTFSWTPADYGVLTQVNYSLEVATAAAPEAKVTITSGITDTTTVSTHIKSDVAYETLNAILYNDLKLADGIAEDVVFFVGAKVGEYSKIYSEGVTVSAKITAAEKEYPKMSVAGSYNGWVHNTQYLFDFAGDDKVYQAVIDFGEDHAANEFKITGGDWGKDEHSMDGAHDPESKTIKLVAGGGDNINVYQAKRYYHLAIDKTVPSLTANVSFDQIGVIGDFNGWGADVVMTFNASKQRFYADVEFPADGGFKFRLDGAWDVSYGSKTEGLLDSDGNIPVKAGNYRVYVNMNNFEEMTYSLDAKMFGKEEPVAGTTPEPEPEPTPELKGWGIVGTITGWADGADIMMTNDGTWYVAKGVEFGAEDKFKIRLDGKWDTSFGGEFKANEEVTLTSENGPDIVPTAGKYDIYFNPENGKAWFITDGSYPGGAAAPEASEWGVVGQVNGWAAPDVTMYKTATEGLFVAYNVAMPDGGFKIRANGEWNDAANYGLAAKGNVEVDHVYDVITGGGSGDMILVAGNYDIWFDLTNSKVYIMTPGKAISEAVGGETPAPEDPADKTWYMVGNFNGWNPGDDAYKMTAEGDYFVFKNFVAPAEVTTDNGVEACQAKFAPGEWNGDKGGNGTFAVNVACATGGDNITVTAGTYDVYLKKDLSVYYFMEAGKTPSAE